MGAVFCFPSTGILMSKISQQTGLCKVPNKPESLRLSGAQWNHIRRYLRQLRELCYCGFRLAC